MIENWIRLTPAYVRAPDSVIQTRSKSKMEKSIDELVDVATEALANSGHLSTVRSQARKVVNAVLPVMANRMLETPPDSLDGTPEWETYVAKLFVEVFGYSAPGRALR